MQTQTLNLKLDLKSLDAREFSGHGAIFKNVDLGGDVILPGAFKDTLAAHEQAGTMPPMFWMHQPDQVPGKWIEMREDSKGLFVKGILADTQLGNEMRTLLNIKAVRGLSIGYSINDREKDVSYDNDGNRILRKIDLWETSIVSLAMNPLARVEASKSRLSHQGEYVPTEREFEQRLRDVGCSKSVARFLIARIFDDGPGGMPDGHRWDAGDVDQEAEELLKALNQSTHSMVAEAFKR